MLPDLDVLLSEFGMLHDRGDSQTAVHRAEELWPALESQLGISQVASLCRYVTLAYYRMREYKQGDVWWQRSMDGFGRAKHLRGIAMLMVTPAFRAIDRNEPDMAEMVMAAVGAIAQSASSAPSDHVGSHWWVMRLYHEKHGYVLARMHEFGAACRQYEMALDAVRSDPEIKAPARTRAELKVRGGWALALYFDAFEPKHRERAVADLRLIEEEVADSPHAEHLQELARLTTTNLAKLREQPDVPFEELEHYDIR